MSQQVPTTLTRKTNDAMTAGQIRYLPTDAAYDLWAEVYDTDGNFLQALDTIEMRTLLPAAVAKACSVAGSRIKAVDLGCGTGRNTVGLVAVEEVEEVVALDLSPKMLELARGKLQDVPGNKTVEFGTFDMIAAPNIPDAGKNADLVVSTLVLEHVPAETFFKTCAEMLKSGGVLLLTNMHAEMGGISQAGFVDSKTGDKIRPASFAHTVDDVRTAASVAGLQVVDDVKEVAVDEEVAQKLGPRGKKWIDVTVWFGGIFVKK